MGGVMLAIVILGQSSLDTAKRIKAGIPDAQIHGLSGRVVGADFRGVFLRRFPRVLPRDG